ncbi:SspB family protein [Octadecabacter temperatus]|uniref:SspB family protein n=1 Tax=Octadecabacter temperatus TaxID=1458307 RepID=UPI0006762131|nr:ClpXP protease specificity-enhancing factor SspB [Octadecabacter temperatus]
MLKGSSTPERCLVSITNQTIDYGNLMHKAMRGLIYEVLTDISANGLPGNHHFFVTFDTMHPDVEIADWLSDRYPGEMTIVIQHQYESLAVTDRGFSITLSFGDTPEPLYVPYDAIKTFVDPSVEFGLRFETQDDEDDEDAPEAPMEVMAEPEEDAPKKDAEVVSLDQFRK